MMLSAPEQSKYGDPHGRKRATNETNHVPQNLCYLLENPLAGEKDYYRQDSKTPRRQRIRSLISWRLRVCASWRWILAAAMLPRVPRGCLGF
jgi:hypothetical protein